MWIQALSSLNTAVKSGTTVNPQRNEPQPTIESLEELFGFCDNALRQEELDDGERKEERRRSG